MLGQLGGNDRVGRPVDVVRDPVEAGLPGVGVELQPRRPRIAVARLADAAGVDQPPGAADLEAGARPGLGATSLPGASAVAGATLDGPGSIDKAPVPDLTAAVDRAMPDEAGFLGGDSAPMPGTGPAPACGRAMLGGPGFVGDDGAPVPGTDLVAACDAIVPSMIERDPEWAGWCSVLTMGGLVCLQLGQDLQRVLASSFRQRWATLDLTSLELLAVWGCLGWLVHASVRRGSAAGLRAPTELP